MGGFDYSKWDKIELSDDEDDLHPNIDKDSWFRLKHRTRVEDDEDARKKRKQLEEQRRKFQEDLRSYGEAGKEHTRAKKIKEEIDWIDAELARMDKEQKWNADNMCKTVENRSVISESTGPTPGPEPRLQGEAVADGYCEFVEAHEELLERYISLGQEDLEVVRAFLHKHGGALLQGEHAESYLLLDCLEKEMNGYHAEMKQSARQCQLLTQLREFSRASGRPARDAVHMMVERIMENEATREAFEDTVGEFAQRIERRAVVKKKEMDAEMEEERRRLNPLGPGGLDPLEVLETLPREMRAAFESKDAQRLQAAVDSLPDEEARYHLQRCEDSGLWVPARDTGPPPYRK